MVKVADFEWDSGNRLKNELKHGITHAHIEAFFKGKIYVAPDLRHSNFEERFIAIGHSPEQNQPMIVAFTLRLQNGKKLIRPISVRYMHKKEAKKYEEAFTQDEK